MPHEIELNGNEKRVLYGLVAYPAYTDEQLAKRLKLKRSTVTAIRRRLADAGYFAEIMFPNFFALGAELLAVKYGNHAKAKLVSFSDRSEQYMKKQEKPPAENIISVSTDYEGFSIFVSDKFSGIKKEFDAWNAYFSSTDPTVQLHDSYLPFELLTQCSLGFAPFVKSALEGDIIPLRIDLLALREKAKKLPANQRELLLRFLQLPRATNNQLAKQLGLTRPTVGKIKNFLLQRQYVYPLRVPDLQKLGFTLLVLTFLQLHAHAALSAQQDQQEKQDAPGDGQNMLFCAATAHESVTIHIYKDFSEYQQKHSSYLSRFDSQKLLARDPLIAVLALPLLKRFLFNILPLTEKLLRKGDTQRI